jgi:hypothetical protein
MSEVDLERLGEIPDPIPLLGQPGLAGPDVSVVRGSSPTRRDVQRRRRAALVLALAWCAGMVVVLGLRGDLAHLAPGYVAGWLALPFALAALALGMAVRATRTGLGVRVALAGVVAVAAPMLLGVLALALPAPSEAPVAASLAKGIATCLGFTLAGAVAPFVFALTALRNSFAAGTGWRSALVGGAAGLLAGGSMNLHCPVTNSMHLLAGHTLPIVIAGLLGALIGRRWLSA